MSNQSLTSIAHNVVGKYAQVGKLIVGTYRSGAQRLVSGTNTRYASFLNGRELPLIDHAVKASLIEVQTRLAGLVDNGIANGSNRAEQAIDFVAGSADSGIERVASTAVRVQEAFDTDAITTVGSLTLMPVAQVSLALASHAVESTKRLSQRAVGADAAVADVAVRAKRVVKKAAGHATSRVKARA